MEQVASVGVGWLTAMVGPPDKEQNDARANDRADRSSGDRRIFVVRHQHNFHANQHERDRRHNVFLFALHFPIVPREALY